MSREIEILDFIQKHTKSRKMDKAMKAVSAINNYGIFWIATSLTMAAVPKTRRHGLGMCASLGLESLLCNVVMKPMADRVRPYLKNSDIQLLVDEPWDTSFPSGHTGASFACASSLAFNHSKAWIPAGILACATGFSRMYLYVHYLSDVLGGVGLGIFCGYTGTKFANKVYDRHKSRNG